MQPAEHESGFGVLHECERFVSFCLSFWSNQSEHIRFRSSTMDTQTSGEINQAETKVEKTNIYCVPGDKLCKADEKTVPAAGTYKSEDYIYASLAGQ